MFVMNAVETVPMTLESQAIDLVLVSIPAGTALYHSTNILDNEWYQTDLPQNTEKGLVWFTSTLSHALPLGRTHTLKYTTTQDLLMIFEQNLTRYGLGTRGYEYLHILHRIIRNLQAKGIQLDGYLGCNECEIAILNKSVQKLSFPPEVVRSISKAYID